MVEGFPVEGFMTGGRLRRGGYHPPVLHQAHTNYISADLTKRADDIRPYENKGCGKRSLLNNNLS